MTKLIFAVTADLVQEERESLLQVWRKHKSTEPRGISEIPASSGWVLGAVEVPWGLRQFRWGGKPSLAPCGSHYCCFWQLPEEVAMHRLYCRLEQPALPLDCSVLLSIGLLIVGSSESFILS